MEQRKLLLADDSITIQKVINLTFADEGIEVTAVGNGATAIERLTEIAPDLVLADVHMPGLNGYEVCERIRATPEFQNVPVMLLVGSFEPFDETEARRVGANDFLTKPFQSIKQLVNKVHGLLEQSATASDAATLGSTSAQEATPTAQEIGFPTENDSSARPDAATASSSGGRSFAFGASEFDDELIETTPIGNNRAEETGQEPADDFETTLENYQATNSQSAGEASGETEPESEWQVVESDFQFESNDETEESFAETTPTMELSPEMVPTETTEIAGRTIENFELENTQSLDRENSSPEDFSSQTESPQNETTGREVFQAGFDATPDKTLDLTFSGETSEKTFAPSTLAEETFEFGESQQTSEETQNVAAQTAPQSETQRQFAETPAEKIKPFIAPLLDDDFLLDLQLDEPTGAAQEQTATAAAEIEPITPEIVAPSDSHQTQELAPINQPTSLEKPAESGNLNALQFPPEVIDAIAARVVEKLSDKVIEKIAWEIVPDRFDLIVRKTLKSQDGER